MSGPVVLVTFTVTGLTDATVTVSRDIVDGAYVYTVDADVHGGLPLDGVSDLPARFTDPRRAFDTASTLAGWGTDS